MTSCANITLRITVRVVDASAFPFLVPGPAPQAAVCKLYYLPIFPVRWKGTCELMTEQICWQRRSLMISKMAIEAGSSVYTLIYKQVYEYQKRWACKNGMSESFKSRDWRL